jgi:hypothetical protein
MIQNLGVLHTYTLNGCTLNFYFGTTGEGLARHEHIFDHLTYCSSGSAVLRTARQEQIITKDTRPINLPANEWHEIEILEPNTAFVNVFQNDYNDPQNGVTIVNGIPMRFGL